MTALWTPLLALRAMGMGPVGSGELIEARCVVLLERNG
jgi:hypothetical protein